MVLCACVCMCVHEAWTLRIAESYVSAISINHCIQITYHSSEIDVGETNKQTKKTNQKMTKKTVFELSQDRAFFLRYGWLNISQILHWDIG